MRQPTFSVLLLLLAATALSAEPEDQLAAGKQLVAQLKLDQDADATLFRQIGTERASTLLSAVMQHGQSNTSSPADWADLHRATAGLVELHAAKGDLFKASMYAGFQSMFYRNFEGDYTAALAASRQALQLQQESGVTATLWISWSNVGKNYQSLGNLDEAVRHLREAQRLQTDTARPSAAYLWRDIVDCEIGRKNLDAARRESEAFLHQAESGTPVFKATALMARSDVLIAENKYSDAVDTVKTARALVTDPVEAQTFALDVVNQLMTCVLDSMTSLPYPQAIALAKQMDVDMPGLPIPISAFAEQSIRSRRRMAGEIDAVLREDTARLQQARAAASVPGQIEILRSLAVTYGAANAPAQRAALLEEALGLERSLLPKNGIPENAGSVYSFFRLLVSLGDVYVDLKDLGKARRNFDEAARGIESLPSAGLQKYAASLYGQAMLGKARVAELDDDPDTARDILKAALSGAAKGKYDRAGVLRQAAYLERSLGEQPAAALAYYEQAIEAMQSAHDKHSELATRLELARYLATDSATRLPDAASIAQRHLTVVQAEAATVNYADARWRVHYLSGILAESALKFDQAITLYQQAVERLDQIRSGLSQQEQRQAFMDSETIQDLYLRLTGLLLKSGRPNDAWLSMERSKARTFLEMLQGRKFQEDTGRPRSAELAALEKKIIALRFELSPDNASTLRGAGREPSAIQTELHDLESRFALARQQAGLTQSRSGQALSLQPLSIAQTQKLLPPKSALLEYALLGDSVAVFVVTPNSVERKLWKTDIKALRKNVLALRAALADPSADPKALIGDVSAALIQPLSIPAGVENLIVVPTAWLAYLPFQVLERDGRALIESYSTTYLPSATTLAFLQQEPSQSSSSLFLGALGGVSTDGWPPLPGTLRETDGIAKLYPGRVRRASEKAFTHDAARQALLENEQVHFATHGLLDERAPLFSALLTSPAPDQPTRLSLYELAGMKLHARLVVLSACETGLGKLLGGDEIAGLTRTFLLAGASTVVSSLWKVSDDATAMLMAGFYRRLRGGSPASVAQRQAALDVRQQFPHPFYWAPFIVSGAGLPAPERIK